MSSDTVSIFYRLTNGKGDKIIVPNHAEITTLYELIADLIQC